jgi:hypothetical protein
MFKMGESMGLKQRELVRRTVKIGAEERSDAPLRLPRKEPEPKLHASNIELFQLVNIAF